METRIAAISIIVQDPEKTAQLNEIIHEYAKYVIGRMGLPYREKNLHIISLVVDAPLDVINHLSGKLGRIDGITAKAAYAKVQQKAGESHD